MTTLHNTPSGTVEIFTVELMGQEFMLINAGPLFKFNPSVSFLVACSMKEEVFYSIAMYLVCLLHNLLRIIFTVIKYNAALTFTGI